MGTGCSSGYALDPGIGEIPSFKIVLVGDAETGKTSVFMRYFKNQFDYSYRPTTTVSIENVVKKVNVPEHTLVSIAMWDLPGREEMDLRQSYYKDVDAAIVIVNSADPESVELGTTWKQDILNHAVVTKKRVVSTPEGSKVVTEYEPADHTQIPVLLLGNKYDLVEERQALQAEREEKEEEEEDVSKITDKSPLIEDNRDSVTPEDRIVKGEDDGSHGDGRGDADGDGASLGGEKKDRGIENPEKDEGKDGDGEKVKAMEEEEKKEVTVWKYEEQQEVEEVPPEIQFLEDIAEKHGFVGSVAVSAKNSEGGVHAAVQALVRHLLERKLKDRTKDRMAAVQVKRAKIKRPKVKKRDPKAFEPLQKTDIKELDDLLNSCNRHMALIHETRLAYRRAVRLFKTQCMEAEVVEEGPKCSMEDCVSGLKASLAEDNLELLAEDEKGFIQLLVRGETREEDDKSEDMRSLLNTFHSEVAVASRTILKECPSAISSLQQLDDQIQADCRGAIEQASQESPLTTRALRNIQDAVDMNRARIKHAKAQSHECLQEVESSYKKIKAAMIW
ncbi:uncharacterized protein [Diadema antillarum]|uniref:uncharacterized protein n=1 Tax=Diadema antillarum TaxID=105358 RepID=UPI003A8A51D7